MTTSDAAAVRPGRPIKLHGFRLSGHSHRAQLMLSLLGLHHEWIEVDLGSGAHKSEEFLQMNVFGQVPVIDDGGVVICDSNAILVYLASKYDDGRWLPRDPAQAAAVQRWLSVAAGQIGFGPAVARLVALFAVPRDGAEAIRRAHELLSVMDKVLGQAPFLTGKDATIADVACYTYVAHAPEGNVSLEGYPAVRAWLGRVEALPRFVPMAASKVGVVA